MSELNLVQFPASCLRDPVKALRTIADQIEAGDFGKVESCGVVIMGDAMEVFGSGDDSTGPEIALLLQAGAHRFVKEIEEHGRTEP